ncbi:hypothetical protein OHB26_16475 [Nocardia sp. NBC_01503]|uniref:hypothetical protein n=1 Tax=Nocardia sp. NBC_01503 TaxID=2975997 RepID=UPI002E7B07D1|nr:hypothetical protein [Nocardia sp. NBC_01503]WTL35647.1 hypothetical protein OHB26_16475 [Nocardia sp. NBC_01503]
MKRIFLGVAAAALIGSGLAVAGPATADAGDECQLGWSNVGPRTCAKTDFNLSPIFTLGNGVCAGMLSAGGTAFDGPLYRYSEAPGAAHAVVLRITQGFSPVGEWGPQLLACDVNAVVDWHNLDSGQTGSVTRFIPAGQRSTPAIVLADTGSGRVQLTVRTDRPNIPASTEVFVP